VDERGSSAWRAELSSYATSKARAACPFRYQGQYEDAETGLYYNRFRYFDPQTGAYISQDPIGLKGGLAPYAYITDPHKQVVRRLPGRVCGRRPGSRGLRVPPPHCRAQIDDSTRRAGG
jgi:RHS repeat-associated protein